MMTEKQICMYCLLDRRLEPISGAATHSHDCDYCGNKHRVTVSVSETQPAGAGRKTKGSGIMKLLAIAVMGLIAAAVMANAEPEALRFEATPDGRTVMVGFDAAVMHNAVTEAIRRSPSQGTRWQRFKGFFGRNRENITWIGVGTAIGGAVVAIIAHNQGSSKRGGDDNSYMTVQDHGVGARQEQGGSGNTQTVTIYNNYYAAPAE
jgi:hypothetical protein